MLPPNNYLLLIFPCRGAQAVWSSRRPANPPSLSPPDMVRCFMIMMMKDNDVCILPALPFFKSQIEALTVSQSKRETYSSLFNPPSFNRGDVQLTRVSLVEADKGESNRNLGAPPSGGDEAELQTLLQRVAFPHPDLESELFIVIRAAYKVASSSGRIGSGGGYANRARERQRGRGRRRRACRSTRAETRDGE